jgi:hypothetical protein
MCVEQSEEWVSGRRYLDLTELSGADTLGTIAQKEEGTMALVG